MATARSSRRARATASPLPAGRLIGFAALALLAALAVGAGVLQSVGGG